jgi:gas vesicle protein
MLPPDATKAMTQIANDAKEKVVAGLQTNLDSIKSQIEAFVPKIQNAPMTQQPALASSLNDVQSKFTTATKQIADLKADYNASNWQKLADDAKASVAALQSSVTELIAKVK